MSHSYVFSLSRRIRNKQSNFIKNYYNSLKWVYGERNIYRYITRYSLCRALYRGY
ncbi:hypothetical protein ETTORE_0420 [Pseudomonas phage Ettore]|nr:hypothetical protein ETTORE_0420 [Pseudomonas phage Ettore]